jgi:hypothetical protein
MATAKQIMTARENGARSTGPATADGKAVSRLNALRHGLTACHPAALPGESAEAFEAMLEDYSRQFKPRNLMERDLVYQLAVSSWNLERSWKTETAHLRMEMARGEDALAREFGEYDNSVRTAAAFQNSPGGMLLLLRYRACHERAYHRALRALLHLRENSVLAGNPRLYESHESRYARAVADQNRRAAESSTCAAPQPAAAELRNEPDSEQLL